MNDARRRELYGRLRAANPRPTTELEYGSPFELLVAVVLSAQATDKSVNLATARLFPVARTPAALLALGEEGLRQYINSIGLYNAKAKNIIALCRILLEQHDGEVPREREALEALPGVGRKTANVVLNTALPAVQRPGARPPGGILAAYGRVLRHRQAMAFILANALSFAAMFVFITDSAFFYMEYFGASSAVFPVLFGANVVVMISLNRLNILLLRRYDSPAMMRAGLLLQLGAVLVLLMLVLLEALTLGRAVPLIMLAVGAVALIIPNALASFLSLFERDAGAATGLNGALQFTLAGLAGGLVTLLHTSSALPMALTMTVCSLCACGAFFVLRR